MKILVEYFGEYISPTTGEVVNQYQIGEEDLIINGSALTSKSGEILGLWSTKDQTWHRLPEGWMPEEDLYPGGANPPMVEIIN